jgi:hypothetical protein
MTQSSWISVAICLGVALSLLASPRAVAAQDSKDSAHLKPLATLVGGEWMGAGAKPGDQPINVLVTYEWGINKELIRSKSYIMQGKEKTQVYESLFAWHPGKKAILVMAFGKDGGVFDGTVEEKGGLLEFNFKVFSGDRETTYRQTFRFAGEDEYVWTLLRKTADGWEKLTETPLRRRQATGAR